MSLSGSRTYWLHYIFDVKTGIRHSTMFVFIPNTLFRDPLLITTNIRFSNKVLRYCVTEFWDIDAPSQARTFETS